MRAVSFQTYGFVVDEDNVGTELGFSAPGAVVVGVPFGGHSSSSFFLMATIT